MLAIGRLVCYAILRTRAPATLVTLVPCATPHPLREASSVPVPPATKARSARRTSTSVKLASFVSTTEPALTRQALSGKHSRDNYIAILQ